jgi:hypothetical protein
MDTGAAILVAALFLRSQYLGNRQYSAFFQSPLTAKPVDNRGLVWMMVETRLASGGVEDIGGRRETSNAEGGTR